MPPGHKSQDSAWGLLVNYSAGSSSVVEYSADSSTARAQTCAGTHARMSSANAMVENENGLLVQLVCISVCVYQWSSLVAVCVLVVHARIRDCNAHRVEDRKLRHMSASAFWARVDLAVLSSRMRGPSSRHAVLMRFESHPYVVITRWMVLVHPLNFGLIKPTTTTQQAREVILSRLPSCLKSSSSRS